MRVNFLIVAGLVGSLAFGVNAQVNDKYKNASRHLVVEADLALVDAKTDEAVVLFESALVADPANLDALIGLGKAHEAQGHVGLGLKYYRQALELDPNALPALEAQALAFLKRDILVRAENNRDKLAKLCTDSCKPLEAVDTALEAYKSEKAAAETSEASGRD
jgi:tetratricopeptide (TPR) repeat protein